MRTTWFVRSKLLSPRPPGSAITRERHRLGVGLADLPRVILLQAPAGFGKTTLAAGWVEQLRASTLCVWVSLDEADSGASAVFAYLVEGLRSAAPQLLDPDTPGADDLLTLTEQALSNLAIAALDRSLQEVLIVLDDVHLLAEIEARDALRRFAERLPPNSRLVMTSRLPMDGEFPRLRARGVLLVLGSDELRFDHQEVSQLIGNRPPDDIERLLAATGGWPVGVQLAQFEGADVPAVDSKSALEQRLTGRVLGIFSPEVRKALILSSLFERVRSELLDYALQRCDGAELLRRLALETPFLLPLQADTAWTRYHALFKDALRSQLVGFDTTEVAGIHKRGAEWFFGRGLLREAFHHGEASGDTEFFADLAERAGGWRLALGGGRTALRAFTSLPALDGRRYPRLRLAYLYSLAQDGLFQQARREFESLRQTTQGFSQGRYGRWDAALATECGVIDAVLHIYEDQPQLVEQAFELEGRMASTENLDSRVASLSGNLLCYAHFDQGEYERCLATGELALARDRATGATYGEIYLALYLGLACFRLGRLTAAQGYYDQALEQALARFGEDSNQAAIARVLLAELLAEQGRLDASAGLLERSFALNLRHDGWVDNYFSGLETLARVTALRDGPAAALRVLEEAGAKLQTRCLPRLLALLHLLRAEVLARGGQADSAEEHLLAAQRDYPLPVDVEPVPRDGRLWEAAVITTVVVALASSRPKVATEVAERALTRLRLRVRPRTTLRLQLLCAVARYRGGERALARNMVDEACRREAAEPHVLSVIWYLDSLAPDLAPSVAIVPAGVQAPSSASATPVLSPREREVLREIGLGLSNKEIARSLGIAESTVKTHRERIYEKLNVSTRSAVLAVARARGLLSG